jgi:translation initiation factor IF-1
MSKNRFIMILVCIAVGAMMLFVQPSMAVPPKDTLTTTAKTSSNGKAPGEVGSNWLYYYELPCNSTFSDTLHVELVINNTADPSGETYNIGFSKNGNPELSGTATTLPANFSLADNGISVTKDIAITTGTLAQGEYVLNISIDTQPGALTEILPKDIQLKIHVNECDASVPACFFTDSNGNFLTDCDGALVSTNEGGTFILVNKKNGMIVATNPGQFYYNYIWTNDGDAVDVQVQLGNLLNLVPHGANAVHAYTFDTSGFTQDLEAFNMVNNDGMPCGPSGPCTINIGEDETLWVTWHLEYSGIGLSKPEAGNSCEVANEVIGAAARLVDANDTDTVVAGQCSSSATGYNKR